MGIFDQYLTSKRSSTSAARLPKSSTDSRARLYKAFAEEKRTEEARTEHSPLVLWARRGKSDEPDALVARERAARFKAIVD